MAQTVSVVVTDDLDGSPGAQTVFFSLDGQGYQIDLGQENLARFRASLQPFMDAGRRITQPRSPRPGRAAGPPIDRAAVRAWAAGQGLTVSERGRISAEVMTRYQAAH
jgi:hypothetical protein